mmetsp:Transcript_9402/g.9164  ORF Transcript_9402/g.9164 Transcript_9402/m.9164 type:complete len:280 (+) Transcript_9402:132-971(+)
MLNPILNPIINDKSKERILLPSSISRLVKNDAVMINKEVILNSNVATVDDSNLNGVADAEDDVDNAELQFECKNLIGTLDAIGDNDYQVKRWDNVDSIVQNYEDDEESSRFIIEEECHIGSVPGQTDNLSTFPNGKDVINDPLFHNNHSSVDNGTNVKNNVVPDMIYGAIYDRSNAENPPPLPPESLDDNVWNLEKDQSNDDNNDFNYDDIGQDILQFKHEDLIKLTNRAVYSMCRFVRLGGCRRSTMALTRLQSLSTGSLSHVSSRSVLINRVGGSRY